MELFESVAVFRYGGVQASVCVAERDASPCHHTCGYGEEFVEVDFVESRGAAFEERGYEYTWHAFADDVAADAYDGGGVERRVYGRFRVVAHDEAAELQPGAHETVCGVVPEFDLAVVVLEV